MLSIRRSIEILFYAADLLLIPLWLMQLNRLFKPNTRRLTDSEIDIARCIFGENIDYQQVWIDERSSIGCRKYHFAYVAFNVINCWGPLKPQIFIHEMVHIWQYQKVGSVYIPRALRAQRTPEGYNYGGIAALQKALEAGKEWQDFNYEQQGDLVADYFCLKNNIKPRWCELEVNYLPVFERIIRPVFPLR